LKLSQNFTLEELSLSDYGARNGIPNTPGPEEVRNLQALCANILQPMRDILDRPIVVTSGYRSPDVNAGIGGSKSSQHMKGQAADIHVPGMPVAELFHFIIEKEFPYDQVIEEFERWVHVSYVPNGRGDKYLARRENGQTKYFKV